MNRNKVEKENSRTSAVRHLFIQQHPVNDSNVLSLMREIVDVNRVWTMIIDKTLLLIPPSLTEKWIFPNFWGCPNMIIGKAYSSMISDS